MNGLRRIGVRLGNWLTPEQGRRLVTTTTPTTLRELRDHAMLAVLIGCGLRRGELLTLQLDSIQQLGRLGDRRPPMQGGHVRTVPIPGWVKVAIDPWTTGAGITNSTVFRVINKHGHA